MSNSSHPRQSDREQSACHHETRLTNLEWESLMYGPYSEDLRNHLTDSWKTETKPRSSFIRSRLHTDTGYITVQDPQLIAREDEQIARICQKVSDETRTTLLDDFIDELKNDDLYLGSAGGNLVTDFSVLTE